MDKRPGMNKKKYSVHIRPINIITEDIPGNETLIVMFQNLELCRFYTKNIKFENGFYIVEYDKHIGCFINLPSGYDFNDLEILTFGNINLEKSKVSMEIVSY
jgi:hypothetical protein